jgi:hypothetical protein
VTLSAPAGRERPALEVRVTLARHRLPVFGRGAAVAVTIAAATALAGGAARSAPMRLEIGAFEGGSLRGPWGSPTRADLDPQAAADGRTLFYFRSARPGCGLSLPVAPRGPARLLLRARAIVRSAVGVFISGARAGEVLVGTGPWAWYAVDVPAAGHVLDDVTLAFRPLPVVPGEHAASPEVLVDEVDLEARDGVALSWRARLLLGAAPLAVFVFLILVGIAPPPALIAAAAAGAATVLLARADPLPVVAAVPRLVPAALLSGLVLHRVLAWKAAGVTTAAERAALACMVAAGIALHGSVAFFPDHNPPDVEIHMRRTQDLARVGLDYPSLLRYGSHLPTPSQTFGQATTALGDAALIPYSPLPYLAYYALHLAGLDLRWSITVLNVVLAMAVAPLLWAAAAWVWDRGAAWLAALLYSLDLAVWHHVGRSHAPASFGGALGTAALLYLVLRAGGIDTRRRAVIAGLVLATAVLGYSSLVVLFGLFGLTLLVLLAADAAALGPAARKGMAATLVLGGLLAGGLFYFHYVPGLLRGAHAMASGADPFPGRTVFIFHNESKESVRIWAGGYGLLLVAGLAAAPWALRRAPADARPILVSWLVAWGLLMLLKEPYLLPKMLRWAKEDQFLSPLLCLFVGAGVAALPRAWMRWTAAGIAVAAAATLQARDFLLHANSLRM